MQLRLTVDGPDRSGADLLIDADPASHVGELAERISAALGVPAREHGRATGLFVGGVEVDPELALYLSPVRDGARLGLGGPDGCPPPPAQGVVEIRVAGGLAAGEVHRLGPGTVTVGGAAEDWIRLDDADLPAGALRLEVAADGECTVTPQPGVTVALEHSAVEGATPWPRGHLLAVGRSLLDLATPDFPDAPLRPAEDGAGLDYNRPPRLAPAERQNQFALPNRPRQNDARPLPWVMAIVPLVAALAMAFLFNPMFLAFALLSPISIVANYFSDKKHGKKTHKMTVAEYTRRRAEIETDAEDALAAEQATRRAGCPDPAAAGLIATGPRHRLWERRRYDPDHGRLRVGTGTLPSEVVLTDPEKEEHKRKDPLRMHEVPVTVDLPQHGVLGVAGRAEDARALGRWLVAQSAVLTSPADLSICVLTDPTAAPSWSWVGWLPHARPREGQQAVALLGSTAETVGRRIAELQAQVAAREAALREAGPGAGLDAPDVLLVLDGSRRLRSLPGVSQLLKDGPAVGIRAICLETEPRLLPEECQAVAALDDTGHARVSQAGADTVTDVRVDGVDPAWCERLARGLAPIRDVSRDDDAALPDSCRLLDVLSMEPPDPERIAAIWHAGGRTTEAVVGVSLDGAFTIDMARDGPHGLVAGTTGSGKSELLQTLIAALAVANRPDAMTFVLVDYKGGSAFAECARLPHTVGMVTDLDTHLVSRALESLGAELRRREHILAAAGVPGLPEYDEARRRDPGLAPMPRLLIVIDEFASLARELPDFVAGLVNVAQRGRSLGIHLILATQRPSGVVSTEIRANTNLRIALRVTDTAESADVIDAPDAARIAKRNPGRAYVRTGHTSLLPFQAARVGGRRPGAAAAADAPPPFVVPVRGDALGLPPPTRPRRAGEEVAEPVTDLAVLVEAIRGATEAVGVPDQHSPWLPALPAVLVVDDLPRAADPTDRAGTLRPAPYALVDVPAEQTRQVETVDLTGFGHLYIAGAARSGRSQALRTIAGSLARENSCADVHLYGLDCGNGALLALTRLPHCGAVVRSSETERVERLLDKLTAAMRERMAVLGERGFTDITEQRAAVPATERLPHLVVLVDRWEGFLGSLGDIDGGTLTDQVLQLLREGASAGVHLVISGDHTLLGGRIGTLNENKFALRLADKGDFGLIGVTGRKVPDNLPEGRAYRALGGLQTQFALLAPDPSGRAQVTAIEAIGAKADERDAAVPATARPFGVDVLPSRIGFEAAWELRVGEPGPLWGMVAVGGDRLTAFGPDLGAGTPAFVIAGPPGSGRSTALRSLAASYLASGTRVLLVAPRPSPLRDLRGTPGVVEVVEGTDLEPKTLTEAVLDGGPLVVLVDDAELLRDCAAGDELAAIVRRQRGEAVGLVLAGDADGVCSGFTGWQVDARKARRGLLLSPQDLTNADLIGTRLTRTQVGGPVEPGRGLLHLGDGNLLIVQVPVPETASPSGIAATGVGERP